jgi:hypothetical protein
VTASSALLTHAMGLCTAQVYIHRTVPNTKPMHAPKLATLHADPPPPLGAPEDPETPETPTVEEVDPESYIGEEFYLYLCSALSYEDYYVQPCDVIPPTDPGTSPLLVLRDFCLLSELVRIELQSC